MKRRLSSILIELAIWLYPDNKEKLAPVVEGYKAGKVGCGWEFGKKELREWQKENNCSSRKAMKELIKEYRKRVKVGIAKTLGDMVEFEIKKHKNGAIVEGHVKVYVMDGGKKV